MPKAVCLHFTVSVLEGLANPEKGIATYKDSKTGFLSLYVTSKGVKTFFVRKRVNGRDERIVIGHYPVITIEQARKKATMICGIVSDRKDPRAEERKEKLDNLTFGKHFHDYMERYSKVHKKSWKYDDNEINRFVGHWFNKKLGHIKKSDVESLHQKIGRENGHTQANTIVRRLSAIFNKAIEWDWQGNNPTKGIKKFKEKSRDRFVLPSEMPYFTKALHEESNSDLRDYFTILLLTGSRKTNTRMMRWEEINFDLGEWRIPETKNGESLVIPLVPNIVELLRIRKADIQSQWVFPQSNNPKKCIADPKKAWQRIIAKATLESWNSDEKVALFIKQHSKTFKSYYSDHTKIKKLKDLADKEGYYLPLSLSDLRIHDIRRTFGSYQALTGASLQIIGKSLGHKSLKSTQIYARLNLDPVRQSMEKASQAILGNSC
jgi:integrase